MPIPEVLTEQHLSTALTGGEAAVRTLLTTVDGRQLTRPERIARMQQAVLLSSRMQIDGRERDLVRRITTQLLQELREQQPGEDVENVDSALDTQQQLALGPRAFSVQLDAGPQLTVPRWEPLGQATNRTALAFFGRPGNAQLFGQARDAIYAEQRFCADHPQSDLADMRGRRTYLVSLLGQITDRHQETTGTAAPDGAFSQRFLASFERARSATGFRSAIEDRTDATPRERAAARRTAIAAYRTEQSAVRDTLRLLQNPTQSNATYRQSAQVGSIHVLLSIEELQREQLAPEFAPAWRKACHVSNRQCMAFVLAPGPDTLQAALTAIEAERKVMPGFGDTPEETAVLENRLDFQRDMERSMTALAERFRPLAVLSAVVAPPAAPGEQPGPGAPGETNPLAPAQPANPDALPEQGNPAPRPFEWRELLARLGNMDAVTLAALAAGITVAAQVLLGLPKKLWRWIRGAPQERKSWWDTLKFPVIAAAGVALWHMLGGSGPGGGPAGPGRGPGSDVSPGNGPGRGLQQPQQLLRPPEPPRPPQQRDAPPRIPILPGLPMPGESRDVLTGQNLRVFILGSPLLTQEQLNNGQFFLIEGTREMLSREQLEAALRLRRPVGLTLEVAGYSPAFMNGPVTQFRGVAGALGIGAVENDNWVDWTHDGSTALVPDVSAFIDSTQRDLLRRRLEHCRDAYDRQAVLFSTLPRSGPARERDNYRDQYALYRNTTIALLALCSAPNDQGARKSAAAALTAEIAWRRRDPNTILKAEAEIIKRLEALSRSLQPSPTGNIPDSSL